MELLLRYPGYSYPYLASSYLAAYCGPRYALSAALYKFCTAQLYGRQYAPLCARAGHSFAHYLSFSAAVRLAHQHARLSHQQSCSH